MKGRHAMAVLLLSTGFLSYLKTAVILIGVAALIVAVGYAVRAWR